MNRITKIFGCSLIIIIAVVLLIYKFDILERTVYDTILSWINFLILAFVIIKFSKTPLMNFLQTKKDDLAEEIKQIETEKKKAEARTREVLKTIEDGESYRTRIKGKIIAQGKIKKEKIIEEARQQSRYMIDDAKQRVDSYLIQERRRFRAELVDTAIALARERVRDEITDEDNQVLLENYLAAVK